MSLTDADGKTYKSDAVNTEAATLRSSPRHEARVRVEFAFPDTPVPEPTEQSPGNRVAHHAPPVCIPYLWVDSVGFPARQRRALECGSEAAALSCFFRPTRADRRRKSGSSASALQSGETPRGQRAGRENRALQNDKLVASNLPTNMGYTRPAARRGIQLNPDGARLEWGVAPEAFSRKSPS